MQKSYDRVIGVEKVLSPAGCVRVTVAAVSRDQTTHNRSLHIPGLNTSTTTTSSSAVTGSHFYTQGLTADFQTHLRATGNGGAKVEEYSVKPCDP